MVLSISKAKMRKFTKLQGFDPVPYGYGSKGTPKSLLVKGKIDPSTCGPRLGFLFDP